MESENEMELAFDGDLALEDSSSEEEPKPRPKKKGSSKSGRKKKVSKSKKKGGKKRERKAALSESDNNSDTEELATTASSIGLVGHSSAETPELSVALVRAPWEPLQCSSDSENATFQMKCVFDADNGTYAILLTDLIRAYFCEFSDSPSKLVEINATLNPSMEVSSGHRTVIQQLANLLTASGHSFGSDHKQQLCFDGGALHLNASMRIGGILNFKWRFTFAEFGSQLKQSLIIRELFTMPLMKMTKSLLNERKSSGKRVADGSVALAQNYGALMRDCMALDIRKDAAAIFEQSMDEMLQSLSGAQLMGEKSAESRTEPSPSFATTELLTGLIPSFVSGSAKMRHASSALCSSALSMARMNEEMEQFKEENSAKSKRKRVASKKRKRGVLDSDSETESVELSQKRRKKAAFGKRAKKRSELSDGSENVSDSDDDVLRGIETKRGGADVSEDECERKRADITDTELGGVTVAGPSPAEVAQSSARVRVKNESATVYHETAAELRKRQEVTSKLAKAKKKKKKKKKKLVI